MDKDIEVFDARDGDSDEEQSPNEERTAADISIRVTSTSNPSRPRTLRAGYDWKTGTMTVVFRDQTWWNYYNVPREVWEGFRDAKSKGEYLSSSGLDQWPDMGEPRMGSMSSRMVTALGKSAELQKALGGQQSKRVSGPRVEAALNRYMRGLGQS
jgi:hypothetical protein